MSIAVRKVEAKSVASAIRHVPTKDLAVLFSLEGRGDGAAER